MFNPKSPLLMSENNASAHTEMNTEIRYLVIYGYTSRELTKVIKHFRLHLPEYVKMTVRTQSLVSRITLTGVDNKVELLRFKMNRFQQMLADIFSEEVISMQDKTLPQVLGELLTERELSVACAESCTGGNIAHRIVQIPGSSAYFLGSIVSYANDVKAGVLGVSRSDIDNYGAVSEQVVEGMVKGVCRLMRTECGIATSGIAGPDGGTKYKPVGTVWIAAKCLDRVVSECIHFDGDRNEVIESATNHGMFMLMRLLRNTYVMQEDFTDE